MTITTRLATRISLIAALLLLAIVAYNLSQPAMTICGDLDPNYQPIIAFELARSVPDLHAIFGDAPSACRKVLTARFAFINTADNYVFIPLYGIFLFFFFLGIRHRHEKLSRTGAILVLAACLADYVENTCLFGIASNPDAHGTALSLLPWATGVKWMGLAIAGAIGGYVLSLTGSTRWLIAGLCLAGLAIVTIAMIDPQSFGYLASNGVTISWVIFLIADAIFVLRPQAGRIE
jgi:hypothetical protein